MPIIKKANITSLEQISKEQVLFCQPETENNILDEEEYIEEDTLQEKTSE